MLKIKLNSKFRLRWWGKKWHKTFTIVVFVILASLDDAVWGIFPPLYAVIARDLSLTEASLGIITALSLIISAVTSAMWGYWADQNNRKPLLLYGTLIWSVAMFLTGTSKTYGQLLLFQLITATGLGCIASVGYSILTDLISPTRRGLMMSLWGLSQGGGIVGGVLLGGVFGAYNWRLPFFVLAGAGFGFAVLYLFTYEPQRGRTEPELSEVFTSGDHYEYRIKFSDMPHIFAKRSNIWLMVQAFMATLAFGSLTWMPRLFIARVEASGYSLETATVVGNLLSLIFQLGLYFAILAGFLGDLWQRSNLRGRAIICTIGTLGAIPFQIALFLLPLPGLNIPDEAGLMSIVVATIFNVLENEWVVAAFLLALVGAALSSAERPNRSALISDVNLPEHRGTVFGLNLFISGVGFALGNASAGIISTYLAGRFAPPTNYAISLALLQVFFLFAGLSYYQVTKVTPGDIGIVREKLTKRAKLAS